MKKFVNDPKQFVPEMLKGIALANPGTIKYVPEFNLIMRADMPRPDKVSIIQGSGSGHEPAHVMIVGPGMLDGACPGDVFAAPPMDYVVGASKLLNSPKGILHIVNNYSGDRMAFEMATEMLEAEGVTVKTLFVDDDVAVQNSTYTVGRRGVAGNFFVIKALGAASENGASLDELIALGQRVNAATRSMGMALTGCTPPAKGTPIFTLADDEMEMGVGIHGEPGRARKKMVSANAIVDEIVDATRHDRKPTPGRRHDRSRVQERRRSRPDGEWPWRHADLGALRALWARARAGGKARPQGVAQLCRRVLHVARNGRHVDHAVQGRRAS